LNGPPVKHRSPSGKVTRIYPHDHIAGAHFDKIYIDDPFGQARQRFRRRCKIIAGVLLIVSISVIVYGLVYAQN